MNQLPSPSVHFRYHLLSISPTLTPDRGITIIQHPHAHLALKDTTNKVHAYHKTDVGNAQADREMRVPRNRKALSGPALRHRRLDCCET
eukprot:1850439-Rhodomonas_salina.2